MFPTMTAEHHEGAARTAATERAERRVPRAECRYGPAGKTAGDIITAQNAGPGETDELPGKDRRHPRPGPGRASVRAGRAPHRAPNPLFLSSSRTERSSA
ncbi:hypothetical protein GCM10010406_14400 [Streptomyces thermolineatus]|uniref:Uncharacterized protein n=1 Tax=Streptomyces thermolineatus TaxID=44033 RepID=A0ABN3LBS2_9ACTN